MIPSIFSLRMDDGRLPKAFSFFVQSVQFFPKPFSWSCTLKTTIRNALTDYLRYRLSKGEKLKPSSPIFITQKGGPYSPNTLQEHMGLILKDWSGIEKASSHSGRRALITNIIHRQKKSVKIAQKVAGHVNPSTTLIYEEPPEEVLEDALRNL